MKRQFPQLWVLVLISLLVGAGQCWADQEHDRAGKEIALAILPGESADSLEAGFFIKNLTSKKMELVVRTARRYDNILCMTADENARDGGEYHWMDVGERNSSGYGVELDGGELFASYVVLSPKGGNKAGGCGVGYEIRKVGGGVIFSGYFRPGVDRMVLEGGIKLQDFMGVSVAKNEITLDVSVASIFSVKDKTSHLGDAGSRTLSNCRGAKIIKSESFLRRYVPSGRDDLSVVGVAYTKIKRGHSDLRKCTLAWDYSDIGLSGEKESPVGLFSLTKYYDGKFDRSAGGWVPPP